MTIAAGWQAWIGWGFVFLSLLALSYDALAAPKRALLWPKVALTVIGLTCVILLFRTGVYYIITAVGILSLRGPVRDIRDGCSPRADAVISLLLGIGLISMGLGNVVPVVAVVLPGELLILAAIIGWCVRLVLLATRGRATR